MTQLELPPHISHSSRETLQRCARAYFLTRVAKAPQLPALWLAGGSAVHEVTEIYDLQQVAMGRKQGKPWTEETINKLWRQFFGRHLEEARAREPNENKWRKAQTEPIEAWDRLGPEFVSAYVAWRERSPWEIWTTPDGEPAIELDISGKLPGCPVEVKAFIDRIFWDPVFKKHHIVDLKTSKKPPKNADQFGTYKALVKVKYGIDASSGVPFMNRRAGLGRPFDLAEYTPEYVGEVFGKAQAEIQEYARTGSWPANGYPRECYPLCDVQAACAAAGGPLAHLYDPASPDHVSNQPQF